MHTDPVADMLTRLRNGSRARHARVEMPRSKLKVEIARILKQEGYITDFREVDEGPQGSLELTLRYDSKREPAISFIERVSKPGLRRYSRATDLPKVRNGLGVMILTTSRGLMTDRDARKNKVGGEVICSVY